jgi:hypothetical protein
MSTATAAAATTTTAAPQLTLDQVKGYFLGKGLNIEDATTTNLTYNKMIAIVKDAEATHGKEFAKFVRNVWDKTAKDAASGKRKFWTYFPKQKAWDALHASYTASIKK